MRGARDLLVRWGLGRVDLLFLALIVFVTPLFFWPGATDYNYARCIFMLVAVSLATIARAIAAARRGEDRVAVPWIVWPLLALVAASLLSLVHATSARVGVESLAVLLAFCQFGLLVVSAVRERRDATLLLSALFASAWVVAAHALLQYFGLLAGTASPGLGSMITTMGNPDAVAGFLACALLPGVLLFDRARSRLLRAILVVEIAAALVVILLTRQTGVVIGILVALAAIAVGWALFRPTRPRRRAVAPSILLAAIGVVIVVAFAAQVIRSPHSDVSLTARLWEDNSGPARSTFWTVGWTMWKENPLTGAGLGNFKIVYPTYEAVALARPGASAATFFAGHPAQAHNDYLQAAAELGSVGVLAVLGLLLVLGVSIWKRLRADASWNRFDLFLLCGGAAVFLFHALVGFPAHLAAPALAAALLIALAVSPAYGPTAVFSVRLGRGAARVVLVVALLAGLAVSVLAARDLAANVLQLRGTRLLQTGHNQAALDALERSVALDFSPRQSYFYLASAQYRLGRYREALGSLERCLTRFPDENALLLYADLAAGLGELDRGMEVLDVLLATNPSPGTANKARYVRALILKQEGDVAQAEGALRALMATDSSYEPSYIALGEIRAAAGDAGEARVLFERALALVEAALPSARAGATVTESTTYSSYAEARDRLENLTRERETIERDLAALPAGGP